MRVDSNHQHHASLLIRPCLSMTMAKQWFLWASLGHHNGWRGYVCKKGNVKLWCQLHLMKSDCKSVKVSIPVRCISKLLPSCADAPDLISS